MSDPLAAFLCDARDAREYRRAVAVQMVEEGIAPSTIMHILQVSAPFISKWKRIYAESGIEALRLKYKGGIAHLSAAARLETITWLKAQDHWGNRKCLSIPVVGSVRAARLPDAVGFSWLEPEAG